MCFWLYNASLNGAAKTLRPWWVPPAKWSRVWPTYNFMRLSARPRSKTVSGVLEPCRGHREEASATHTHSQLVVSTAEGVHAPNSQTVSGSTVML